ncbi:hypothetical protein GCM10009678_94070 [Actinomadura kijaniata]|uniref:Uncharacterized protein n=1 Tax=Actinomadura namibiensis TaxID=182080 RepID=A0A7W3LWT8_ACTNM|nr:hypothetical protein [Actinomadura namibiensis]MBA8955728.1 hypothetical protein [Actinomadura namibiensis]
MELRPELSPPPVPPERLGEISAWIERIERSVAGGEPVAEEIGAFNAATGHRYGVFDFATYRGARTLEEFALEAARPAHPRVPDVTRAELVEIVRRVLDGDPETGYYLLVLDAGVARRDAADLIFHPPPGLEGAPAGEIVDAILAYRPFSL